MSLRLRAWPNGLTEFEMFGVRGQGADLGQSPEATVQSAKQSWGPFCFYYLVLAKKSGEQLQKSLAADKVRTYVLSPNVLCKVHPGSAKHQSGPALGAIHF